MVTPESMRSAILPDGSFSVTASLRAKVVPSPRINQTRAKSCGGGDDAGGGDERFEDRDGRRARAEARSGRSTGEESRMRHLRLGSARAETREAFRRERARRHGHGHL